MAVAKPQRQKPSGSPFTIRSLSITPEDNQILERVAQDASDYLGWTVSGSAVVRALLRLADQRKEGWFQEMLFPFIEQEIEGGRVWGKKK